MKNQQCVALGVALPQEDALYQQLRRDEVGFALWTTTQGLVATRSEARLSGFDEASEKLANDGWPVYVRGSGGGAVPQGGTLNLTRVRRIASSAQLTVEAEYEDFCGLLRHAFRALGVETAYGDVPGSYCDGRYNLVSAERKLVGTAQRWSFRDGDRIAMAHALINIDVDFSSACTAINQLYALSGSDKRVLPGTVVNWSEFAGPDPTDALAATLTKSFQSAGHRRLMLIDDSS